MPAIKKAETLASTFLIAVYPSILLLPSCSPAELASSSN